MQQQNLPPPDDSVQLQEPDLPLATYGQRLGAWTLDFVGFALPLILLIIGVVVLVLGIFFASETGRHSTKTPTSVRTIDWEPTTDGVEWPRAVTVVSAVVVGTLAIVTIGYIVWWLIALGRGQTPGKQIVGIRVIKDSGEPSGWGYTFLREFVIKFLLVGSLTEPTFGLARLVDYLWPLWDRAEKMQTLHDKLLGTIVVRIR